MLRGSQIWPSVLLLCLQAQILGRIALLLGVLHLGHICYVFLLRITLVSRTGLLMGLCRGNLPDYPTQTLGSSEALWTFVSSRLTVDIGFQEEIVGSGWTVICQKRAGSHSTTCPYFLIFDQYLVCLGLPSNSCFFNLLHALNIFAKVAQKSCIYWSIIHWNNIVYDFGRP